MSATTNPLHPLISRTAAQLATERPDGHVPQYLARDAARAIRAELPVWLSLANLGRLLQREADRIARLRSDRQHRRRLQIDPVHASVVERYQCCAVDADADLRSALRRVAGCSAHDSCPVRVVWGVDGPRQAGSSYVKYHWHNGPASGTVYHPSTRRVEVGVGWLSAHLGVLLADQAA